LIKPVADGSLLLKVRQRYRLPEQFLLYLGTIEPRKNIQALIKAYALLCREKGFCHKLVLAGDMGWKNEGLRELIQGLSLEDSIRFTGYVEDSDLPALYTLADLFVFPSLYEGFGLPVLEAMACGLPVVTSNVSSLPEVAGDAAVLIDPHSLDAIADGMRRMLVDRELRTKCIERGFERAKMFTWEKCAKETVAVFREAMALR